MSPARELLIRAPLASLLITLSGISGACSLSPPAEPLLIGAAASLSGPLQEIAPVQASSSGEALPQFHFASSGTLQQQLLQGAPLDVFLSAGERQMEALQTAGLLLEGSHRELFGNRLVLVVPARAPSAALALPDLGRASIRRIAIGEAGVPAGDYARQTLASFGLTAAVQDRLVPLASARAVARAVASGDADAGFVYASDAAASSRLRVSAVVPQSSHAPIRYSGAVLRSSPHPERAGAYLDALTLPAASGVLRRHGFLTLAPSGGTGP